MAQVLATCAAKLQEVSHFASIAPTPNPAPKTKPPGKPLPLVRQLQHLLESGRLNSSQKRIVQDAYNREYERVQMEIHRPYIEAQQWKELNQ